MINRDFALLYDIMPFEDGWRRSDERLGLRVFAPYFILIGGASLIACDARAVCGDRLCDGPAD